MKDTIQIPLANGLVAFKNSQGLNLLNDQLSFDLLERGTRCLEKMHGSTGRVNLAAARAVGDASLLLGFEDFASRCEQFLRDASPQSFWQGVITNIPFNKDTVSDAARSLTPIEEIELVHPDIHADYPSSVLVKGMGDHIAHCLERDYDAAYLAAGTSEYQWHEVTVAQALNGDIKLALPKLSQTTNQTIRRQLLLVFAIESYRRGDNNLGAEMHGLLKSDGMDVYACRDMALGVRNRIPLSLIHI